MKTVKQIKNEHYDKFSRYSDHKKFYHSAAWQGLRDLKIERNPLCECCQQEGKTVPAAMVHHSVPVTNEEYRLDILFLVSLCHSCHNRIETEMENDQKSKAIGRLSYNDK